MTKEDNEKADKGICPECGGKLEFTEALKKGCCI